MTSRVRKETGEPRAAKKMLLARDLSRRTHKEALVGGTGGPCSLVLLTRSVSSRNAGLYDVSGQVQAYVDSGSSALQVCVRVTRATDGSVLNFCSAYEPVFPLAATGSATTISTALARVGLQAGDLVQLVVSVDCSNASPSTVHVLRGATLSIVPARVAAVAPARVAAVAPAAKSAKSAKTARSATVSARAACPCAGGASA